MTSPHPDHRPWFREPMLLLVFGLPLCSIIAGFSLLGIAINAGGADAIPQEVRRTGKAQVGDISADRQATAMDLRAELRVDRDTGAVSVEFLRGEPVEDRQLVLTLSHPTAAAADATLPLMHHDGLWIGRLQVSREHDWNAVLAPGDNQWRLIARLDDSADRVRLHPALTAD